MAVGIRINDRTREASLKIKRLEGHRVTDFAETMVEHAKEGSPFDSGNNRDSIARDPVRNLKTRVFTRSGYGYWLEVGTSVMPPRPYFAPAADMAWDEVIR